MEEIKNLKKVAKRIVKAIKKKERIILYADADLDGTCSLIILEASIKNLGGKVAGVYFPNREKEGYGINETALAYLKKLAPALLIASDCGIGNVKEVELAKKLGFEVIILDHHQVLDKVPKASIIVDPKQKGDKSSFKEFAATGILYKLAQVLLGDKLEGALKKSFLELVALATLADMMPQIDENQVFIIEGLGSLKKTSRPGLKVFWKIDSVKEFGNVKMVASKIIAALNTAGVENHLTQSYILLNTPDEGEAEDFARGLIKKSEEKQQRIKDITWEVQERAMKEATSPVIFEGDEDWPLILMGAVASRICRDFQKPTFLYRKGEAVSRGAVRTPKGINSVEVMKTCADLLITFGGHPLASGFTVENENLEKFKQGLIDYFLKIDKNK